MKEEDKMIFIVAGNYHQAEQYARLERNLKKGQWKYARSPEDFMMYGKYSRPAIYVKYGTWYENKHVDDIINLMEAHGIEEEECP